MESGKGREWKVTKKRGRSHTILCSEPTLLSPARAGSHLCHQICTGELNYSHISWQSEQYSTEEPASMLGEGHYVLLRQVSRECSSRGYSPLLVLSLTLKKYY